MKNLLLADVYLILGVSILVVFVVVAIFLGVKINQKMSGYHKDALDFSNVDAKSQLIRHIPYLWPKEFEFLEMFKSILPDGYLIVPKVGVDKIVKPHGSLVVYNAIKTKYVDFCVFQTRNMEPVVVLDCFYPSIADSTIKEMDKAVVKALDAVDIPVLKYEILDTPYDKAVILKTFLSALDPIEIAKLKVKK